MKKCKRVNDQKTERDGVTLARIEGGLLKCRDNNVTSSFKQRLYLVSHLLLQTWPPLWTLCEQHE